MCVYIYICMYVCMYVCICICVCIYIYIYMITHDLTCSYLFYPHPSFQVFGRRRLLQLAVRKGPGGMKPGVRITWRLLNVSALSLKTPRRRFRSLRPGMTHRDTTTNYYIHTALCLRLRRMRQTLGGLFDAKRLRPRSSALDRAALSDKPQTSL